MFADAVVFVFRDLAEIEAKELQEQSHRPPEQHEGVHGDRGTGATHQPIAEAKCQYREEHMAAPNINGVSPP